LKLVPGSIAAVSAPILRSVDELRSTGSDAHDSTPDAHDSTSDAHDSTSDAHDSTPDAHDSTSDAHAHAHAHENAALASVFPHERLDAYRVALELLALANRLAKNIPRGHRSVADHMLRAASNTSLLLAEGANRRGAGEKRQRFVESRGECAEVAAAADILIVLEIGSENDAARLKGLASRVSAMLTRLIARLA